MAEASTEQPKKTRRPRLSKAEVLALLEEVEKRRGIILGRLDDKAGITSQRKQLAWQQVCDAVNRVSHVPRTADEIRRKFADLKSRVKCKAGEEIQHLEGTG